MEVVVWAAKEERLVRPYQDNKRAAKAFQEQMVLKDIGVWMEASKSTFKTLTILFTKNKYLRLKKSKHNNDEIFNATYCSFYNA